MRRIIYLLIALIALSAKAHAWTQVSSYAPTGGPVAAGAAGSTLQNSGWIDEGGYWSINSSNQLSATGFSGSGYATANLYRPSGEAVANSRTIFKFVSLGSGQSELFTYGRASAIGSGINGYAVGVGATGQFDFYAITGGNPAGISGGSNSGFTQSAGTAYQIVLDVTGSSPTTITAQLQSSTGAVLAGPQTVTDSTSALQGTGVAATFLASASSSPLVTQLVTCSGTSADGGAGCGVASYGSHITITPTSASLYAGGTQTFSVDIDGPVPSGDSVVVTPSTTIGTLSPASLTFTANTAQTLTLTAPGSAGSGSLTGTHAVSGGTSLTLADYSSVPITVSTSSQVAVNSPACHFSPGNWHGDTGRGGSVYREAWVSGAYFHCDWTAAASSPTAILQFPTNSSAAQLFCFLNGVLTDNIPANGNYTLAGLTAGAAEDLLCFVKRSTSGVARWNAPSGAVLKITGLLLDGNSTPGTATIPSLWGMINSDSICEGDFANAGTNDFSRSACFFVMQNLMSRGYDVSIQAASGTGFLIPADTPALYYVSGGAYDATQSRWNLQDAGVSLLDSAGQLSAYGATGTMPAFYLLWYGGNDCENNTIALSDLTASVSGVLGALRTAGPTTKIIYIPDFPVLSNTINRSGCLAALNQGVANYLSAHAGDTSFSESQPVGFSTVLYANSRYLANSVHPNESGNAISAPFLQAAIDAALAATGGGATTIVSGPIRLGL